MKHVELAKRLEEATDRLTARVLGEMYQNPFWHERFGARADKHGKQDGRFHLEYVIQALHADDPNIMHNYARWLQPVLTSRGMCTRHLAENFERLAAAIRDEGWPDAGAAVAMLDAACAALEYTMIEPRALQRGAKALATVAADELYARHPEWLARWGEAGRARCVDDLVYHVHYAADALALDQAALFESYAVWLAGFLERRNVPRSHLIESLQVLKAVAPRVVPGASATLGWLVDIAAAAVAQDR